MTTTIENYCIDCKVVAQPDCESRGHVVGTLGQADSDSDTERDADYDIEQERIKFQKELGAAMVKAGAREIELPRITYRCPNCGQIDSHTDECPSNPQRYEHDAPVAPERGDAISVPLATEQNVWRVVKTIPERPTSDAVLQISNDDGLRLPWHRQELLEVIARYANGYPKAAKALNEYKQQHSTLIAQRERLLQLLRPVTSPTACYCAVMGSEKCWHCEARELITTIEQDQIASRTTSEQEGRTEQ